MKLGRLITNAFFVALTVSLLGASASHAVPELDEAELTTLRALERLANDQPRCFPRLDGPAEAHVFYTYQGDGHVAGSIKKGLTRYADVRVEQTDKPALLILSAYSPVIWRIDAAPGARIAGIYLSGYNQQMLENVPPGVTVSRTVLTRTDGRDTRGCAMSVADLRPLADLKLLRDKQARRLPPYIGQRDALQRQVDKLKAGIKALEQARIKLALALTGERPILTIDKMIDEAKVALDAKLTTLKVATAAAARHEQELRATEAEITAFENQMRQGDASYFATYKTFRGLKEIRGLSTALAAMDIDIVNYVHRYKEGNFIASTDSAAAYTAMKERGAAALAALRMPELPLLPEGSRWMKPPYSHDKGVAHLVENGYLRQIEAANDYYCTKRKAASEARGIAQDKCGLYKNTYTALGGFRMPSGLCGGYSITVLVPEGVPMPRGDKCHSAVIDLSRDF